MHRPDSTWATHNHAIDTGASTQPATMPERQEQPPAGPVASVPLQEGCDDGGEQRTEGEGDRGEAHGGTPVQLSGQGHGEQRRSGGDQHEKAPCTVTALGRRDRADASEVRTARGTREPPATTRVGTSATT